MKPTSGIAALAFFAFALFGSGMFLHGIKPMPAAETAKAKPAAHTHSGKGKSAGPKAALKTAAPATASENSLAFPLMVAGGIGLLLAALAGLNVSRSLGTVPQAVNRKQAAADHGGDARCRPDTGGRRRPATRDDGGAAQRFQPAADGLCHADGPGKDLPVPVVEVADRLGGALRLAFQPVSGCPHVVAEGGPDPAVVHISHSVRPR